MFFLCFCSDPCFENSGKPGSMSTSLRLYLLILLLRLGSVRLRGTHCLFLLIGCEDCPSDSFSGLAGLVSETELVSTKTRDVLLPGVDFCVLWWGLRVPVVIFSWAASPTWKMHVLSREELSSSIRVFLEEILKGSELLHILSKEEFFMLDEHVSDKGFNTFVQKSGFLLAIFSFSK